MSAMDELLCKTASIMLYTKLEEAIPPFPSMDKNKSKDEAASSAVLEW